MSRAAEALASIPPATRLIVIICSLTYAMQIFLDPSLSDYSLNPDMVLVYGQFYRLVTGALLHANLLHIAMNMSSTLTICGILERRLGTMMTLVTIVWGIILVSSTYVILSRLSNFVLGMGMRSCVGFSGVIFQLCVLEANIGHEDGRTRSVFGMIEVSSKAYPWALLLALQFIMPQVSFLGHLSGILIGTIQCRGYLDGLFPSSSRLRGWEASYGGVAVAAGYVPVRESDLPGWRSAAAEGGGGGGAGIAPDAVVRYASSVASRSRGIVRGACEGVRVVIFGRGDDANANARMDDLLGAAWGSGDVVATAANSTWGSGAGDYVEDYVEDDDEWVGLPAAIHTGAPRRGSKI
jgi:rhomboid domain-containing protein 1